MLRDNLEGWDWGEVGGRIKREEIYTYIYIYMAYLHCSIAETNTAEQSNYPAIKKKINYV